MTCFTACAQVAVTDSRGGQLSTSEWRPVDFKAACVPAGKPSNDPSAPAAPTRPSRLARLRALAAAPVAAFMRLAELFESRPAGLSPLERLVPAVNWPMASRAAFWAAWCIHCVALLLAPRLLGRRLHVWVGRLLGPGRSGDLPKVAAGGFAEASAYVEVVDGYEGGPSLSAACFSPLGVKSDPSNAVRRVLAGCYWQCRAGLVAAACDVLRALVVVVENDDLWYPALLFSANLAVGPWFFAQFHSDGELGAFTAHGILFKSQNGASGSSSAAPMPGFRPLGPKLLYVDCPDTYFIGMLVMLLIICPLTLWLLWVVGTWKREQQGISKASTATASEQQAASLDSGDESAASRPPRLHKWQVLAVLPMLYNYCNACRRLLTSYGPPAVLLSPAVGWLVPLAALWLWFAAYVVKGRSRLKSRQE